MGVRWVVVAVRSRLAARCHERRDLLGVWHVPVAVARDASHLAQSKPAVRVVANVWPWPPRPGFPPSQEQDRADDEGSDEDGSARDSADKCSL